VAGQFSDRIVAEVCDGQDAGPRPHALGASKEPSRDLLAFWRSCTKPLRTLAIHSLQHPSLEVSLIEARRLAYLSNPSGVSPSKHPLGQMLQGDDFLADRIFVQFE
jgi:hypothetical protein